jgi:hypothetical protein
MNGDGFVGGQTSRCLLADSMARRGLLACEVGSVSRHGLNLSAVHAGDGRNGQRRPPALVPASMFLRPRGARQQVTVMTVIAYVDSAAFSGRN